MKNGKKRSLPVRERGLKPQAGDMLACDYESLPVRERGLKRTLVCLVCPLCRSLPVRERGLKPFYSLMEEMKRGRSPCGSVD